MQNKVQKYFKNTKNVTYLNATHYVYDDSIEFTKFANRANNVLIVDLNVIHTEMAKSKTIIKQ